MRVEFAIIAGLLSSSAVATYGNDNWGKTKTITRYWTKVVVQTKTCTVTKPKFITKTKTEYQTITVTATPEASPPEEEEPEAEPAKTEEDAEPEKDAEPADKKPADDEENNDEEKPVVKEDPPPDPVQDEEEPAADEAKPAPATHTVQATSKNGKPVFDPPSLMAATGDTVKFEFVAGSHSVARGVFDKPCTPLEEGGFFSNILPASGDDKPSFSIKVTDSDPIWFYCTAGKHCQAGMVGVINPGPDDKVEDFAAAAAKAPSNVAPKKVGGGITKRKRSFYIR